MFRTHHILPRLGTRRVAPLSSCSSVRGISKGPFRVAAHWTPEKLDLSGRYALSAELSHVMNPAIAERHDKSENQTTLSRKSNLARPRTGVHLRNQIVSPDLCDDILKYIAPSLEQHKGCDILDINPGACLWSQKLHEHLQPRRHILLEPKPELFKTWIDPLINAPDSKYKLIEGDPLKLETYRDIVNNDNFPHQTFKQPDDPKGQELNPTLLVTGSLAWDPLLPGFAFDSMAKQLYNHFATASWTNDVFNAFGPVRSLLWVGSDDFSRQIAKSMSHSLRSSLLLELANDMYLVATSERAERSVGRGAIAREPQYEIQSTIQTLRRAKKAGISIPEHRRDMSHYFAEKLEVITGGSGVISAIDMYQLLADEKEKGTDVSLYAGKSFMSILDDRRELMTKYPDHYIEPLLPLTPTQKEVRKTDHHPAQTQLKPFRIARTSARRVIALKITTEEAADIDERMLKVETKAAKLPPGPEKDALLAEIDKLEQKWQETVSIINKNYVTGPHNEIDDRLSLRHPTGARIQWDRRPFDPLRIHEDEVWPRNGMSLISSTPIARPTSPTCPDFHEWVLDFAWGLYNEPGKTLPEALNGMHHGLSDIIKDCPSVTDPEKGGRLNLKHLRVRMVTKSMLEELTKAYMAWPFKWEGSDHSAYFRSKGRSEKARKG